MGGFYWWYFLLCRNILQLIDSQAELAKQREGTGASSSSLPSAPLNNHLVETLQKKLAEKDEEIKSMALALSQSMQGAGMSASRPVWVSLIDIVIQSGSFIWNGPVGETGATQAKNEKLMKDIER